MVEVECSAKRLRSVIACSTIAPETADQYADVEMIEEIHWLDVEVSVWDDDKQKWVAPDYSGTKPWPWLIA